jgi:DNA integrity scanning protein DisA with diadenylate cyclase activity
MQNQMQAAAEAFEQQLKKDLQANHLPEMPELMTIRNHIKQALRHESMATLGCSLETYRDVVNGASDLYSVSFAVNSLQARTPQELNLNVSEYLLVQEDVATVATAWNDIVEPLKKALARKLQTQARISQGVPGNKLVSIGQA